ncbi:MAG: DUF4132 domain-containing protein, partial [Leptospiraceae bacterium]|nr:DUF4132 domain-containing protein [Leptospiraceae bacterium]
YDRHYTYKNFQKYLFNHGLMSIVAKTLLWTFYKGTETQDLFFYEGKWIDVEQKELVPDETYSIRLWHPVGKKLEDILSWREFFMEKEIKQAIKQVFREVYILTDAELETRVYSNRMAAHILKQHQFNTLAKGRTWSYSLLGAYDDGRDGEIARISIPEYNLSAEFWINEIYIEDSFNDAGIWNYVGTDQIRFIRDGKPEELLYIPPIVLSEVMRDTDLFVGVASVGNDPEWSDRGAVDTQHRNYWQTYSFGNLNETAKVRKQILERLLPRLKIAKVAEIKDKFLLIKGSIRTYKIHIGSTNILMEPNDEYLCIVADRKKDPQSKIFLPFEGDAGLSLLLSKAFLLAEDDKIVDSSIVSQIKK